LAEHLTQKQVDDYCRHKLSAAEILSVSDHLAGCEACRREVERALNSSAAFFALRSELFDDAVAGNLSSPEGTWHPTLQEITEYVDGVSASEDLQAIKDHLTRCDQCVLAVNDLRAFRDQVAPELKRKYHPAPVPAPTGSWWRLLVATLPSHLLRPPGLAIGSALTLLLLFAAGWLVWKTRQGQESKPETAVTRLSPAVTAPATPGGTSTASPSPLPDRAAPVVAQLNDSEGRIMLDREGRLSGADNLPPIYQRMLKDALTSKKLEESPLLAGLNRPGSSLMSGDVQGNKFSVIEPVGKVMLSDRPTFRWSLLEGSTGYVVEVFDDEFNLLATSPHLTENSWTTPQPLNRGGIYSWQVKASKDGLEFISPHPPAPQAKFRVLDQAKVNEIAQARRAYASSHLTLGLLYAQAGLLDEARRELHALQMDNPESPIVRRWLVDLQALQR
jgi:anti-sigma factor RsiW